MGQLQAIKKMLQLLYPRLEGTEWCHLVVDYPEWTRPEYYHQN